MDVWQRSRQHRLWWLWCDVNKKDLADDDYATDEDSIGDNVNNFAKCKMWQGVRWVKNKNNQIIINIINYLIILIIK